MRRSITPLALLLVVTLSVHADDVDDFIAVARGALSSPHPVIAYYEGVLGLPDFDLDESDLQRVIDDVGTSTTDTVGQSLDSIKRLKKRGTTLRVERDAAVTIHNDDGYTRMRPLVKCVVKLKSNGDVLVDTIEGITAGRSKNFMVPLRKVLYTFENGAPVAKATLGYWPFLRTLTLKIDVPAPTSPGLAGSVSTP
jgi:hypothetical protein